tara:strand:- start:1060 stop:1254 length:195 start_codon:yes stop_codon:yes gene_type:complete
MANNGGAVIADKTKLEVLQFTGTAAVVQAALRAAIANADIIISCDTSRKKDSNDITLTVVAVIA